MVDWKLVRERARAYRRSASNTWTLFKESKIGVAGVVIMSAFVILALLAPVLGLRDPINWRAPSKDTIELQTYWTTDTSTFLFGAGDPIRSQVAYRLLPSFTDQRTDRIYAASGDKLLAINPATGTRGWHTPFQATAEITAGPLVVNFGSHIDPLQMDQVLLIGTADGRLYALNDSTPTGEVGSPGGSDVTYRIVQGGITSIAAYSDDLPGRNPAERIYVATDAGFLYSFEAQGLTPSWNRTFGAAVVRMAGGPLNPPTNPAYSPALTQDGSRIFVNAGQWIGLWTGNGTLAWSQVYDVGTPWTSAPVVALPSNLPNGRFAELVYAASDDGWLFARYATTGEPYEIWTSSPISAPHPSGIKTIPVMLTLVERDPGPLFSPWIDAATVYVASRSGHLYSITRDAVGAVQAGAVRWRFADPILTRRGFGFTAPPVLLTSQRLIYVAGVDPAGTSDPSDDQGVLFGLTDEGLILWRRDFNATLSAPPSIGVTTGSQLHPSVWIGAGDGWIYSIESTGRYLAPLPPGTYPSGNQYLWGTDNLGRDILSQFIWGSRIALIVGFAAALLSVGIGAIVGLVAGYVGRKTEIVLMRFTDVILVLPTLPLLIILSAVLGASIGNVILVIALLAWPSTARVIRAEILTLKERPYIQSAKVTGASNVRIMFRHLLPNVMPLVFLYMTFAVSGAILFEAALSFLGLGDVNTPSWGLMLSTIQSSNVLVAYWWLLPPGLGITVLSLAFYFVGRAFEQIINPRLRLR